jgi:hypothetical protein
LESERESCCEHHHGGRSFAAQCWPTEEEEEALAAAECLRAQQHRAPRVFGPPSMPRYGKIIGPDVTGIERACYVELDADGTPRSADKTIPSGALPDVEPAWTSRLPIGDGIQKFTEDEEVRLGLWKLMRSTEAITARDA